MHTKPRLTSSILGTAMLFAAIPAGGATTSTLFSVAATVLAPACAVSVSPVSFARDGGPRARSEVSVVCAQPTPYTIRIDVSQSSTVSVASRTLNSPDSLADHEFDRSHARSDRESLSKYPEKTDLFDSHSVANWHTPEHSLIGNEVTATIVVSVVY
jgi:hypothetical protein